MNKIAQGIFGVRNFFGEVRTELKKCAWPTREELMQSTVVVIVSLVILGVYVGLSDSLVTKVLNLIIK